MYSFSASHPTLYSQADDVKEGLLYGHPDYVDVEMTVLLQKTDRLEGRDLDASVYLSALAERMLEGRKGREEKEKE